MLQIEHISKTFNAGTQNEVRALRDVSLTVPEGSFLIVLGTNGSGKSTLLNAVAGAFIVDSGKILVAGQEVTSWPEHRRAKLIGRVFQDPFRGTAPTMSIAENLVLASRRGRSRGLTIAVNRRSIAELRDRIRPLNMGLEDRLQNPIGSLSGGQRQALTLLMASWIKPQLLLLDEHTAALDPKTSAEVEELAVDWIDQSPAGRALVWVSHDIEQGDRVATRKIYMENGCVKE